VYVSDYVSPNKRHIHTYTHTHIYIQMYRAARMEALLMEGAGVRGVEEDASWGRALTEDAKGDRCEVTRFTYLVM
jgi:hypothetical protein